MSPRILTRTASVAWLLAILTAIAPAWVPCRGAEQNASRQFAAMRAVARDARQRNDAAGYLAASRDLYEFLHRSPRATLQLLSAQLNVGDRAGALSSLRAFIALGGSDDDALKDARFTALRSMPEFAAASAALAANAGSESRASQQSELEPVASVPEDIDYDASSDTFFITSVLQQRILSLRHFRESRVFAEAPDRWPMMALKVDAARGRLWATEVAVGGGKSALLLYDLKSARLVKRVSGPDGSQLGDLAVDARGEVLVSDGEGGGIYRFDAAAAILQRVDHGEFVSPQTPCPLPDGRVLIPDYVRGIAALNLATGELQWLSSSRHQLDGIDGLYLAGQSLIATQNGASPERVVRFFMDKTFTHIESQTIIERATPSLGDPTHGVVVAKTFYYLANSGWEGLDEHAHPKQGVSFGAPLLMRAAL